MSGQKIWASILSGVREQVSSSTFKTWFAGSFVLDYKEKDDRNLLVVGLKNNFLKEQVETRYVPIIEKAAKKKGLNQTEVVFVVSREKNGEPVGRGGPLFSGVAPAFINFGRKVENISPLHTFDNFVVAGSNNLAFLAAKQVSASIGSLYNPFFVWGPTGVGKTHLLQACGNEVLNKFADGRVLYVSSEKFTNDYIESLNNRTQASFRQKYRSVDVLLIDDVQFFAGKESTQDEFFCTFNELYLGGKQIVLACDRHPKDLGKIKERLVNRFLGGMVVDIGKPDLELRIAILEQKCKEKGVNLGREITTYIAETCQAGARELEGVLVQVLALTRFSSGQITLEAIKEAVEKNQKFSLAKPSQEKVVEVVSRHFQIKTPDLCGQSRKPQIAGARQILMYLLRHDVGLTLSEIGRLVGGRDHSTVIYNIGKIDREVTGDQSKKDEVARIRLGF